jgi:hypothetical protein
LSSSDRFRIVMAILAPWLASSLPFTPFLNLTSISLLLPASPVNTRTLKYSPRTSGQSGLIAIEQFESEYKEARMRLEKANAESYTAPEWCFKRAQRKIKSGHYTFGEDLPAEGAGS